MLVDPITNKEGGTVPPPFNIIPTLKVAPTNVIIIIIILITTIIIIVIIIIITRPWPGFGWPGLEWIIGW